MKKNAFRLILILGIVLGMGYFSSNYYFPQKERVLIGGQEFRAERAETQEERSLGLGKRDSLCQECAMLFIFSQKDKHSFWMKEMRFPIDIIWFNSADGKIEHLEKNIPADSQKIYSPLVESDRVLEINGGWVEKLNLQLGDKVIIKK